MCPLLWEQGVSSSNLSAPTRFFEKSTESATIARLQLPFRSQRG